jgi:hypothetical protein
MSSRSNARFIPHIGKRVPFGIVRIASTYLISRKKHQLAKDNHLTMEHTEMYSLRSKL